MRIDPLPSSTKVESLTTEQLAEFYLEDLAMHQEEYFQQFHAILTQPGQDHTLGELNLKNLGQSLEMKASRARDAIQALHVQSPEQSQQLKLNYEKRFDDLHSLMSDLTQTAVKKAKEAVDQKFKEVAAQMPINPADALALQLLIQQCRSLIVLTREQLQLVSQQSMF